MTKIFEDEEINNLLIHGEYIEAYTLIQSLKSQFIQDKIITLEISFWACKLLYLQGELVKAQKQVKSIIEENKDRPGKLSIESLFLKGMVEWELGQYDNILKDINIAEKIIKKISDEKQKNMFKGRIAYLKGLYYEIKSVIDEPKANYLEALQYYEKIEDEISIIDVKAKLANLVRRTGDISNARTQFEEVLDTARKKKYVIGMISGYMGLSSMDRRDGNLEESLKKEHIILDLRRKLGNSIRIARSFVNIGVTYELSGELQLALENYKRALVVLIDLGNKQDIAIINHNIGGILTRLGELDEAVKYLEKGLQIFQQSGNVQLISASFISLGKAYYHKGDLENAKLHFQLCLQLKDSIKSDLFTSRILYEIIIISIDLGEHERANEYLSELKHLSDKQESKIITQREEIASAFIKMTSTRARDRVDAEVVLKRIVDGEVQDHDLMLESIIKLCELHLSELKQTGNKELLRELHSIAERLLAVAKSQKSHLLISEAYWLQSQIALIEFKFDKARELLNIAQIIAEEKNLKRLAVRISMEHDRLLESMDEWKALVQRNASIIERMEITQLEEFLLKVIRDKQFDAPKLVEESPILFMIQRQDGLPIYTRDFIDEDERIDDAMISGFISAINRFLQEAFSGRGSIERVKHKDYTIAVQTINSLLVCYIFKGQTFMAMQKVIQLIDVISKDEMIWNILHEQIDKSEPIAEKEHQLITKIIDRIFLEKQTINS